MEQVTLLPVSEAPAQADQFVGRRHQVRAARLVVDVVSRNLAAKHPGHLAEYAFGIKLAPFHWEWCELVMSQREAVVKAARGHGKSTIFSVVIPCWMVGVDSNLRVVIGSATAGQSEKFLREIGLHIQRNPRYRAVFGDLYDPELIWTQKQKTVRRSQALKDATFLAVGVGSGFAGSRADVLDFDDLVDESNSLTVGRRRQTLNWILETALPALDPLGPQKAVLIGTPYHHDDALFHMAQVWPSYEYPAEDASGAVLWPERFSREELDRRRRLNEHVYTTQYLVQPVGAAGNLLLAVWLQVSPRRVKSAAEIWGVDWAAVPDREEEGGRHDFNVVAKFRVTPWGLELYDLLRFQAELPDALDTIAGALVEKPGRSIRVACETNGIGQVAVDMLRRLTKIPLEGLAAVGDPETRIRLMAPFWARGQITIAQDASESINHFRNEWVAFPFGQHDDCLNAADVARRAYGFGGVSLGMGEA